MLHRGSFIYSSQPERGDTNGQTSQSKAELASARVFLIPGPMFLPLLRAAFLAVIGDAGGLSCVAPGSGGHQLPWSVCALGGGEGFFPSFQRAWLGFQAAGTIEPCLARTGTE